MRIIVHVLAALLAFSFIVPQTAFAKKRERSEFTSFFVAKKKQTRKRVRVVNRKAKRKSSKRAKARIIRKKKRSTRRYTKKSRRVAILRAKRLKRKRAKARRAAYRARRAAQKRRTALKQKRRIALKKRRAAQQRRAKLYKRTRVRFASKEKPGTIIINTKTRHLYHVQGNGRAVRYGVAVGRQGYSWSGVSYIRRKAEWPTWTPPAEMIERKPSLAKWKNGQPGGPSNPLGAAALYLYQGKVDTLYRIHGTNKPSSIGHAASSGCIRMRNEDIQHLYARIGKNTKVIVQ